MKKTHHTTSGTLSMKRIAGGIWAFVFFVAALLCIVLQLAQSQGGGIEGEVRGHGIARQVQCVRDGVALWTRWTCQAGEIVWEGQRELPARVVPQQAPYTVLASSDWSGREFPVSSHLPMDWRTAGGLHQAPPGEILLAPGHPSGAGGWWAVQVFIPPLMVVAVAALVEVILRRRRGYQKAR